MLFFAFIIFAVSSWAAERSFLYDYDGNVILMRDGVGLTLKPDISIQQNDILKTDSNATADVLMNQLAGIRFYGDSECEFENIRTDSMYVVFNQGKAILNMKAMPTATVFSIETPTAVIKTDVLAQFSCVITEQDGKLITTVAIRKGSILVHVKSSESDINVLQNQALDISTDTFISAPRNVNEEEEKLLKSITSVIVSDEF